jgi:hypothetical protein
MEKLKKYLILLPIVAPIIYFLGYVVINSYLSQYSFYDFDIFSPNYLRAGILFSIFITIIFYSVYIAFNKATMTDNYLKSWPSLLTALSNLLFITFLFNLYLVGLEHIINESNYYYWIFIICVLLYFLFRIWSDNKSPINQLGQLLLIIPSIILLIPVLLIFAVSSTVSCYIFLLVFIPGIFILISMGLYGDNNYKGRILSDIIILLGICFFFGMNIYPNINSKFGGGKPYKIIVNNIQENDTSTDTNIKIDTFNVIYESGSRLLLQSKDNKIIFTNKNEIPSYQILNIKYPTESNSIELDQNIINIKTERSNKCSSTCSCGCQVIKAK